MAGIAEQYWKELRPSSAARRRLNVSIRHAPERTNRDLRRPRHKVHPKPRSTTR